MDKGVMGYSVSEWERMEKRVKEMREALEWLVHLGHGVGKAGGAPEAGEFEAAIKQGEAALEEE